MAAKMIPGLPSSPSRGDRENHPLHPNDVDSLSSAVHAALAGAAAQPVAPPPPPDYDNMYSEKDKAHSSLDIVVNSDTLFLKGTGVDVEPALLSGNVVLNLTEPTSIKEITLVFRGKARLPNAANEPLSLNTSPLTYLVCSHDWSFLEGEKKHSHTLKAGRHYFPFQLQVGGSLPSSLFTTVLGGASVHYKLRAVAVRPGFAHNMQAVLPITIMRSLATEALEYQQTLEIENTWPEKLMYSIMIPHKAWAAGDRLTAIVKFSPLAKGARVLNVSTTVNETIKLYLRAGCQENTRVISTTRHELVDGRARALIDPDIPEEILSSDDVVTTLDITIPLTATPTHTLEPIIVSHRIRWSILIGNRDGHTSELRCSLPLHVLDHRLLEEARAATAATRRLLLGGGEHGNEEEEEEAELPSYPAHVRDRVADPYMSEGSYTVANPYAASGAATPSTHGLPSGARTPYATSSGVASPVSEGRPSLAFATGSTPPMINGGTSVPLDLVNSELLASLAQQNQGPSPPTTSANTPPDSSAASRPSSRGGSRRGSRRPSRASSPERGGSHTPHTPQETYVHGGSASRGAHGLFHISMKPFTSLTSTFSLGSRSHGHTPTHHPSHSASSSDLASLRHAPSQPTTPGVSQDPNSGAGLLHRAFTEVPDYESASRPGGGLPPLSSLTGLPSYEEAERADRSSSDSDLASRFAQGRARAPVASGLRT
ncbi:hypothetical protein GLOTRDRAFT_115115 [Gloeophyllum trabeum ATCC 11539]|uniref:Arrestin C-terminal-like domain-containing protein n=1 Tax=Gloeophyllum trabeum (strain ATCC 11539 / FP-39264 / Madison 617) TaxID=670483 RepID=S7RR15_GLOTA|nr:uncharacterized protein GLOTRDRAFT_115115 [Gloeophyllum trabeum ATCC 11539]EPQ57020.1 hypothetical protein GLOTRDRAFT_115115 [Gloeophyllum trabeum ATCC 11539]